jgi:peptidoglycan hydrolase CwlO-like protein
VIARVSDADAKLIAAAPDLLRELEETANWLNGRAADMRAEAAKVHGQTRRQNLRDEAARFDTSKERAAVRRKTAKQIQALLSDEQKAKQKEYRKARREARRAEKAEKEKTGY